MLARQFDFEFATEPLTKELALDATPLFVVAELLTGTMFSRSATPTFELGRTFKLVLLEFEGTVRLVLLEFALPFPPCCALCNRLFEREEAGEASRLRRGGRSVRSG